MWKTTVLSLLCFALSGSTSQASTTTTTPTPTTNSTVSGSTTHASQNPNGNVGGGGTTKKSTVVTTTAPKIDCKTFQCDGQDCFVNATTTSCPDTKCALVKTTNGTDVHYQGKCDSGCAAGKHGATETFCCTTADCNINANIINNNPQQGNDGTRSWARSSLILGSLLTTTFVLLV